jgi:hypothetical protein
MDSVDSGGSGISEGFLRGLDSENMKLLCTLEVRNLFNPAILILATTIEAMPTKVTSITTILTEAIFTKGMLGNGILILMRKSDYRMCSRLR